MSDDRDEVLEVDPAEVQAAELVDDGEDTGTPPSDSPVAQEATADRFDDPGL